MTALGLAVLRLTLGAVLVAHGSHQLFGVLGGPAAGAGGLSATAAYFAGIGLTHPFPLAVLAGAVQLFSGLLIAAGFLTRWVSLAVIAYLGLLMWKDQMRWGYFLNWTLDPTRGHGVEYFSVMAAALLCLALMGGGDFSVDGLRSRRAAARAFGRARLRTRD